MAVFPAVCSCGSERQEMPACSKPLALGVPLFHCCVSSGQKEEKEDVEKEEEEEGDGVSGITRHGGLRLLKIREWYCLPLSDGIFPVKLYNSG